MDKFTGVITSYSIHYTKLYDIEEYAQKIETMGEEYGGEIEVLWSAEDNVTPAQINEVRAQIMAYEAARQMEQENSTHLADGTPNFQSWICPNSPKKE